MAYNLPFSVLSLGLGFNGVVIAAKALRPFKIYCASPSIISQLVLFLWQTVETESTGTCES